jgi:hypothetical protein
MDGAHRRPGDGRSAAARGAGLQGKHASMIAQCMPLIQRGEDTGKRGGLRAVGERKPASAVPGDKRKE